MARPAFVAVSAEQALAARMADSGVSVWCVPLDLPAELADRLMATLDVGERQRAANLRLPNAGLRALAVRGWLRGLLGAALGIEPALLEFGVGEHGKPALRWPESRLRYSLSHTHGWMLLALSQKIDPGADLEMSRLRTQALTVAQRYFTPTETALLAKLPEAECAREFLRLWTCKEAVLKAMGRGIAFGLARLEIDLDAKPGARLTHIAPEAGSAADWQLVELEPSAGLIGALAWRGPQQSLKAYRVVR